jgi:hypothetical protein
MEEQHELDRLQRNLEAALDLRDEYHASSRQASPRVAVGNGNFDWASLTRNAAIRAVLQSSPKPLMPKHISAILAEHGRAGDSPNLVSAALANMRGRGKVVRTQKGWTSPDREPPGDERIGDLLGLSRPEGGRL